MKTNRPISINVSIAHGICNYNCVTCGVNKATYQGPKAFMSISMAKEIVARIKETEKSGLYIRYVVISGSGEPTIHPEFLEIINVFGELHKSWTSKKNNPPEVGIVTNGTTLGEPGILEALIKNKISLKVSFPTSVETHYGEIMMNQSGKGKALLEPVLLGIEKAMQMYSSGKLPNLEFHISPPHINVTEDFPITIDVLTKLSQKNNLSKVNLVFFPIMANRTGLVKSLENQSDLMLKYIKKFNFKKLNNVKIFIIPVLNKFFNFYDIVNLFFSFKYPCLWNGNLFLSPFGDSCCCNDQNLSEPQGNISTDSIARLVELNENQEQYKLCETCNQSPGKIKSSLFFIFYGFMTKIKITVTKMRT